MSYQWLFDRPIAHRGLHDDKFPENSLPAYDEACKLNYNIEIDTHLTKDGHVVVHHDDNLKRICGYDKKICDCTLEEIKALRLCGTEYTVPTLKEVLDCVAGRTGILCEIKGLKPFDYSIAKGTIEAINGYDGPIALQSFNFGAVKYAKKRCDLPVGELCTWSSMDDTNYRWTPANFMGKMWICRYSHPDFISYNVKACDRKLPPNKYIVKWRHKLPILFWTIDTDEKLEDAQKYANNIIFEYLPLEKVEAAAGTFLPFECPEKRLPKNFGKKA